MGIIGIALAAFFGAVLSATVGFLDAKEPFDTRKYVASIIRAIIGAVVFAVGYGVADMTVSVLTLFYAFLGGAGLDAFGNRIQGTLKK